MVTATNSRLQQLIKILTHRNLELAEAAQNPTHIQSYAKSQMPLLVLRSYAILLAQ